MIQCFGGLHHSWQMVLSFAILCLIEILYEIKSAVRFVTYVTRHSVIFSPENEEIG